MLPEAIPTVRVTGRFLTPEGKPLAGQVIFRAPGMVTFPDSDVILGGPVAAPLDSTGAFEIVLPATDAPDMNPSGWSYSVAEQLAGVPMNRTYQVLLPAETPAVDLADIAPTDPTTPTYVAVRGDSAYEIAVENGYAGTVEQWLASLVGPVGPAGSVDTVNGQAGPDVTLTAVDVGAAPTVHTHTPAQVGSIAVAEKGAPSGVATLDPTGKLTAAQRPARSASRSVVITAATPGTWTVWQAPRPVTVTGVRAYRTGGTAATVNARRGSVDLLTADLSLTTVDTWLTGPSMQNTAISAGDSLAVSVRSATGGPTVTIQLDYQEA
ncbi:hypothetical protein [Streptomyces sp. NPDC017520]|uniref:hypothetical protein n=1 Tax=Streptomyces sp. NPDC017520 TaxID=3364998 RepID=UPI003789183F